MIAGIVTRRLNQEVMSAAKLYDLDKILARKEICMETLKTIPGQSVRLKKKAAVLIPMCALSNGKVALLYTLRSPLLSSHSGQVSFPGGKCDPEDKTFTETALRETEEELGIPRSAIEVWGEFPKTYPGQNYNIAVTPVIGLIRNFENVKITPNPAEVQEYFLVPLEKMCNRRYFTYQEFRDKDGDHGFTIPTFTAGNHRIWGMTGMITHLFLSSLFSEKEYPMAFRHLTVHELKPPKSPL